MVSKEECESLGMIFVASHSDGKGGWTRAYCRESPEKMIEYQTYPLMKSQDGEIEEINGEPPVPYPEKQLAKNSGKMKLKGNEIKNIKVVNRNMHAIEGKIDTDIHKQDFEDIPIQDSRLMRDAEKEGHEGLRLNRAQEIEGEKRHSIEKAKRSRKNLKAMGKNVKAVKRKIRADKRSKKRERKLERLNSRAESDGLEE